MDSIGSRSGYDGASYFLAARIKNLKTNCLKWRDYTVSLAG